MFYCHKNKKHVVCGLINLNKHILYIVYMGKNVPKYIEVDFTIQLFLFLKMRYKRKYGVLNIFT